MPNCVKISCHIKKCPIQEVDFDCSVCMQIYLIVIRYRWYRQTSSFRGEKGTCGKIQIEITKAKGHVRVYTDGHICDTNFAKLVMRYILFSVTSPASETLVACTASKGSC